MKTIVPALIILALLSGCARRSATTDPSASPATITDPSACTAAGGKWKAVTRHCDMD